MVTVHECFLPFSDTKTELGKELRKRLDEILEKIKDAVDNGRNLKEDTLQKVIITMSMLIKTNKN